MAIAGLAVAREMGLAVPGDLSIVAWDDSPLCQLVHPPLTAVGRDIPAYGAHAARLLLDSIAGVQTGGVEDETARLRPRGSTARPATDHSGSGKGTGGGVVASSRRVVSRPQASSAALRSDETRNPP